MPGRAGRGLDFCLNHTTISHSHRSRLSELQSLEVSEDDDAEEILLPTVLFCRFFSRQGQRSGIAQ